MITLEKASQKSIDRCSPLGAPYKLLVGVVPAISSAFDDPPHPGLQRGRLLAFLADRADQATVSKKLSSDVGVVGAVEV